MPHDPYKALYVHIPFCVSRCGYCDFATEAIDADDPIIDRYVDGVAEELEKVARDGELADIESIYIGGGTPSHIGAVRLERLLGCIARNLAKSDVEFTVEANPESFDEDIAEVAVAYGVNRISIGVQSFDDGILKSLGRAHDADRARAAIRIARQHFHNVSIDLMCGIPGQTDETLAANIEEALALDIPHVSVYALTIEPHTAFYRACMEGRIIMPSEDAQADQLELVQNMLMDAGRERYEVSNYALPGFESRHNCAYWMGVPYVGIGTGATTMTQNAERRMRVCNGQVTDDLDACQMAAEDLMLGMRMAKGVSDGAVAHAQNLIPETEETLEELLEDGLLVHEDGRWKPTERGWLCGNEVYSRLMDLAP